MNNLETNLKKAYKHGTQKATQKKDDVWAGISCDLEENTVKHKKTNKKLGLIVASVAALLIVLGALTPAGQAAMSKILEMFSPQKDVVTVVEGETEEKTHELHTPEPEPTPEGTDEKTETQKSGMTYVIYIDESNYEVKSENGVDIITPLDYPEDYPEVSMTIYQEADKTPQQLSSEIKVMIDEGYDTSYEPENVNSPIEAIYFLAHDGVDSGTKEDMPQWDSDVTEIYLVDNTQGGTFVIRLKYFMEATEGHGDRLKTMVGDFEVIPAEQ